MKSYAKWKDSELSVTRLFLDPLNPRLPIADMSLSQADLIEELVVHDDVYGLAKSITEKGYYPGESLIGVQENGKKYILEGNRRLAALKLLISPEAAPERLQKRFKDLSDNIDSAAIGKTRVIIAPSRKAAAPIIQSRHTGEQIKRWEPIQQAKFYRQQLDRGMSVEELSTEYAITEAKIRDFLRSYTMYNVACHLDLPSDVQEKVRDPRMFPSTTLDRLYNYTEAQKFLGVRFDDNKELVGSVKPDEFKKGYCKMVEDVATGAVDSRTVNNSKDVHTYLSSFGNRKPDLKKKGKFVADDLIGKTPSAKKKKAKKASAKPKTPKQPVALIPRHIKCTVNNQRIIDIFQELKNLRVARFPNAVAIMLRSLLEMSVGYYLDKTGKLKAITEKARKRNPNLPRTWSPSLKQMLKYIINVDSDMTFNPQVRKALNNLISDKNSVITADSLDLFVHNMYWLPTEDQLRAFWVQLEQVFKITLLEPTVEKVGN